MLRQALFVALATVWSQRRVLDRMHNRHAWTERDEDGIKREIRVIKRGGAWRFQSKRADEERWIYYDQVPLHDLEKFRDVLFRKYQRRRAAYEDVRWVETELVRLKSEL